MKNGDPRTPADAAAIQRFDSRMAVPVVLSAVVPLFLLPNGSYPWLAAAVFIVSWVVFLVDLVFHVRHRVHYLLTAVGAFDLVVVVLTAPWFLFLPNQSRFIVLIRLARLARVVMATRGARRLFERLGRVAIFAVAVVFIGAAVAYRAEHAVNPEYKTYGDALWWAIVTLTTVGYGDVVPQTTAGRIDGVMIMITGIGILGVLAGSMASFFRLDSSSTKSAPASEAPAPDALVGEMQELRTQVARLADEVARLSPPTG